MPLQPIRRRSVPDEVFEQLAHEVVGGSLGPGEALPSERRLAELLGVSRPAVREALQRLSQAGLVEVRQGGTTTVRDFRLHAGLELLPRLLVLTGDLDLAVARSLLEARLLLGPQVAGLAARKLAADPARAAAVGADLRAVVRRLAGSTDPVALQHDALEFWDLVVDAGDNIAFRLMFNSLRAAYEPAMEALAVVMAAEVEQAGTYSALAEAVAAGDPEAASAAAQALLGPVTEGLLQTLLLLEAADPDDPTTRPED
ncbi:FadR/GntR family transcriptional regulator [Nocardioides marmoribigeumensis]|uniref:DNA-binding FadR family transcriptional regulator n=1 Tax=Nocardioides marmoribigeumensis TaxID=433649 RepID=A0ABU2BTK6_9ACTN|nr:GntR family transcriptional regulator [Nocardioides marmoribigeumensis]MDR7361958.1 DNA-binding FadR family transcriptional regulator [Nocardioides marmoribigeumensis]